MKSSHILEAVAMVQRQREAVTSRRQSGSLWSVIRRRRPYRDSSSYATRRSRPSGTGSPSCSSSTRPSSRPTLPPSCSAAASCVHCQATSVCRWTGRSQDHATWRNILYIRSLLSTSLLTWCLLPTSSSTFAPLTSTTERSVVRALFLFVYPFDCFQFLKFHLAGDPVI